MDKKVLKNVISGLVQGQEVTVNFRNSLSSQSGSFTVMNVKKGKGKGGSLIAELRPLSGGDTVVVGTPQSDDVLNVLVNGSLHGFETEEDVPLVVKPNGTQAANLKETLKSMQVGGGQVRLSSTLMSEFNGVFTVKSVKPSKGRYGQVIAELSSVTGETVSLWSYRHSGAIDSIEAV